MLTICVVSSRLRIHDSTFHDHVCALCKPAVLLVLHLLMSSVLLHPSDLEVVSVMPGQLVERMQVPHWCYVTNVIQQDLRKTKEPRSAALHQCSS